MREPHRELGQRIRDLRARMEMTQADFAARLKVTQPTVHRWEKGFFEPDHASLATMAEWADLSEAELRYGPGPKRRPAPAPVVGYVGAGAEIYPFDDHPMGVGLDEIDPPPDLGRAAVAVAVRGDSMYPMYLDGDLLFYSRDPADGRSGIDIESCIGRDCVVKVADGPTLVKRVIRGGARHAFTLISYNAPPRENVRLEWASPVRWIRRR